MSKQGKRIRATDSRGRPVSGIYQRDGRFIAGFESAGKWRMETLQAATFTEARREGESRGSARGSHRGAPQPHARRPLRRPCWKRRFKTRNVGKRRLKRVGTESGRPDEPPKDGQRRPSRRNSARTVAPSLMLRTASAKLSLPTPGEAEAVIAAGISATVASRRKSGMPRRRARMDACTSAPSDNRLRRSAAAVNATGDDASWPQAESRFTRSSPSGAGVMRWRRFPP
jgi:hypothetical protein